VSSPGNTNEYEKQIAVILPKWVLDMMLDQLDTQYDSLVQEQEYYQSLGDHYDHNGVDKEISLYERAIKQIDEQLNS
jgi:hypothetical protein